MFGKSNFQAEWSSITKNVSSLEDLKCLSRDIRENEINTPACIGITDSKHTEAMLGL